jgi:membrane peptidoglycan carboxypeptidase
VSKLTVSQGALLAGLVQAPSYYEPRTNPAAAEARWNYVLDGMVTIHHLDPGTRAAEKYPKTIVPPTSQLGATGPEALIVTQVKAELQRLGISEAELSARGLQVQTTIDQSAQRDAENAIKEVYSGLTAKQKKDKLRKALVAINPSTGGVLAYYGGSNGTGYDYAQAWRAPGSSFKPYTLAAALAANLAGDKPAFALNSMIDGSQPAKLPACRRSSTTRVTRPTAICSRAAGDDRLAEHGLRPDGVRGRPGQGGRRRPRGRGAEAEDGLRRCRRWTADVAT